MAETRREEEDEECRDLRDVPIGGHTSEHPGRTKSDYLHLSQRPLSSLRPAIKQTKTCQTDHTGERRWPEITCVSAEPLATNGWYSGTSVVFPSPLPPQSGWSAGLQPGSQPPPSYDQVIQEKNQEKHIVKPLAAPRYIAYTTTSATQTDPEKGNASTAVPKRRTAPKERPAGKKPQKPPRPSLPKSEVRKPVVSAAPTDEKVGTNSSSAVGTEQQNGSKSDINKPNETDSSSTCTRSVIVHWNIPAEITPSSSDPEDSQRPVPLPRTKSRIQPFKEDDTVQTLVRLSEDFEGTQFNPEEVTSNKYFRELLEVFCAYNKHEESTADSITEETLQGKDADGDMSHNHRNIQARIQAFESQPGSAEASEPAKPELPPRKVTNKPPVAAKPSVTLKPQFNHSTDDSQNVSSTKIPPTPAPKPQPPKKPTGLSIKEELETLTDKGAIPNRSRPPVLTRAHSIHEEEPSPVPPKPPVKPVKEPLKPNLNVNNHNSTSVSRENQYVDSPSIKPVSNVDRNRQTFARQSVTRRPTTIRVPGKTDSYNFQDNPPPLPAVKPVGNLNTSVNHKQSPALPHQESFQCGPELSLPPRLSKTKTLPPRPPPAKAGPGRPPPPRIQNTGRSNSASWNTPAKKQPLRNGPVLPPRPNPGHCLYNKYTLQLPHGIAATDHNGTNKEELSFQKNEVLVLRDEIDPNTYECQVGDNRGRVHKSHMKIITPLGSVAHTPPPQDAECGLKVQAIFDFIPESPGELSLRAGDVVTMVEQLDSEWYRGTCRGSNGFFPVNYVKVLSNSPRPLPSRKTKPPAATASGPRCVARFDFEGEHSDELSFSEGDVIQLKAYIGQEWARGQIGTFTGIFPLNFVEVIEDLPPHQSQQQTESTRIPLPGMASSQSTQSDVAKPTQVSQPNAEWGVALYDFAGSSESDLSFQQGDFILISHHIDSEWSCGQLSGREGIFPRAFVESTGQQSSDNQNGVAAGSRARALYDFTSDCTEELSLQVGDIITNLESIDEEWFLGDLNGKRALVPKNYVQVLK